MATIPMSVIYERLIEVQRSQADIARDQAAASVRRDEIMGQVVHVLSTVEKMLDAQNRMLAEQDEVVRQARESFPQVARQTGDNIIRQVDHLLSERTRRLVWWLFAATFLGSLLGGGGSQAAEWLLKVSH